jgi:hypothetical protein
MKTKQIVAVSACSVAALVFLAVGALLLRGFTTFSGALDTFRREKNALGQYYARDPFPSEANIQRELNNAALVGVWYEKLLERLMSRNIVSTEESPSLFRFHYENARKRLKDRARVNNVQVSGGPEFAYGFERYANTGELPKPEPVPRLMEQLTIIENICGVLFDNGIKHLAAVRRDDVESSAGAPAAAHGGLTVPAVVPGRPVARPPRPARPGTRTGKVGGAAASSAVAARSVGKLYTKLHFGFDFKAKQGALLGVLNALSSNDMFVVVTSVSMAKTVPEMVPAGLPPTGVPVDDTTRTLPPAFEGPVTPPAAPLVQAPQPWERKKAERIVSGPEHEIPVDATVELDVYKFQRESKRGD